MGFMDKGEDQSGSLFSEINVTPFVDVMLVLLIIFMVTAPFMSENIVRIDMPKGKGEAVAYDTKPLILTIEKDGKISIADNTFTLDELYNFLLNNPRVKSGEPIYIQASKEILYDKFAMVMSKAYEAGAGKINIMMEQP